MRRMRLSTLQHPSNSILIDHFRTTGCVGDLLCPILSGIASLESFIYASYLVFSLSAALPVDSSASFAESVIVLLDRRSLSPVRALLEEYEFASGVDFALKIFIHSDRNWRSPALSGTKCAGAFLSYARYFPSGPHFPYFWHKGLLGLMASTLRTFGCSLRFLTLLLPVHGTNQATHAMGCEGDKDHCVEQIRF